MSEKVLVAYASTHGSTQEIAEFIAAVLRECGLVVDIQQARNVKTLQGYDAVVLGAPLYMFRWHADAPRFLSRHKKAIGGGIPVAIFAGGPMDKGDAEEYRGVREQLDKELAKFSWFKPVAIEIVGGRFDPTHLRFPYNLIPALKQIPASDLRNWDAIRTWVSSLAEQF